MTVLEMKVEALMKCVDQDSFEKAMAEVGAQYFGASEVNKDRLVQHEIQGILIQIGIPAALVGYRQMAYGLELAVKNPDIIDSMTKEFYPAVAERFGTTPSRTERALRHAIEVAWKRSDWDTLNRYFGNTICAEKGKPTNSEFVAQIAYIVRDRVM